MGRAAVILLFHALLLALAAPAVAQAHRPWSANVVVPQSRAYMPAEPRRVAAVEVVGVDCRVGITEQVATTTLDLRLHNRSHRQQESEVLLPLPEGAVVRGMSFEGSAKEIKVEVLERARARDIYDRLVGRTRDPMLVEFAGFNLVRSSVFPVPAGGRQTVRLVYEQVLPSSGSRVDYALPRSESVDYRVPWSVEVDLRSKRGVSTVYSPSHPLEQRRLGKGHVQVRVRPGARSAPGSFRLSYLVAREGVSASLFAYPDPRMGGGYFLLLAGLPTEEKSQGPPIAREVTVVLDRSGSMKRGKMAQARAAALQVVGALSEGEAFNVIAYNEVVDSFARRPVDKEEGTLADLRRWLEGVRPRGGTNIGDALVEALSPEPRAGALPIVLFLTDGLPTVGRTSEVAIRDSVRAANAAGRRVFTFGVGFDVNAPLLRSLAGDTRGAASFVLPGDDIDTAVQRAFARLSGPVFADPELAVTGRGGRSGHGRVRQLMPSRLPDLFAGDQLVLLGQYVGKEPLRFEVKGNFRGEQKSFKFDFDLDRATTRNAFVPRLWASRRIAVLVDEIRRLGADADRLPIHGQPPDDPRVRELTEEIVRLSAEFGVLTEYTAFFAREGEAMDVPDRVVFEAERNLREEAMKKRSGKSAVSQSMNAQARLKQKSLNPRNAFLDGNMQSVEVRSVKQMADRAFFKRGKRWVDGRLLLKGKDAKPRRVVRFGTREFDRLVQKLARAGQQAAVALDGEILLELEEGPVLVTGLTK